MASSGSFNTGAYSTRYLTFSWSVQSQSISSNSTTISWTLKGAGGTTTSWYKAGNFKVIIDGATVYSSSTRINLYNGTTVASGTYTMSHSSSGTRSFSAYAEAGIYTVAVNCSGSGSWDLPTIPRAATISNATNFNDTANPTITYSNLAGNSVSSLQACISLTGAAADISYRDIPKTGTSYTFNLTEAERNVLRQAAANSNTLSVRFYVATVIGGTTYRNYTTATMTIVDAAPTFSAAYLDTNSTTTAITDNNQLIIRNQSTLQINVTSLSAKKSSTISSVTCALNGTTYTGTVSGTSCTFNIGKVNIASNTTATVKVTDSRGNSASQNLTIQILDWVLPTAIITMQRENNYYSNTSINVDGSISSVNNLNSMTIKLRYKKVSDTTWSGYTVMSDNEPQTFTMDNEYEWNVQVVITDLFGNTTYNLILSRGMPIIFFDRLKSSTGFNCFPQDDLSMEVNGYNMFATTGGTITVANAVVGGRLSNSQKELRFSVPLPKYIVNLTPTVTTLMINVRTADGGYLLSNAYVSGGYNVLTDSNLSVNCYLSTANLLTIEVDATTAWTTTNNTPQAVDIVSLVVACSAS